MPTKELQVVEGTNNTSYKPGFVIVIGDESLVWTRCPAADGADTALGGEDCLMFSQGDVVAELL